MAEQEARDDEREALVAWLDGEPYEMSCARAGTPVETTSAADPSLAFMDGYQKAVDHVRAILAAGYRKHPEPEITEAMVERGARAFWTEIDPEPVIDPEDYPAMRKALEAALRVPVGEGEQ